jgi:ribonuclease HI
MILNIYTDASTLTHLNNASGIGVVVTFDNEIYKTIGQHVGELNIGDAELFAMVVALKEAKEVIPLMETDKVTLVRIISDCMSALDIAVGDGEPTNDITWSIANKLDELHLDLGVPVEFQWVKAHNGNYYNEIADGIAYEHAHN